MIILKIFLLINYEEHYFSCDNLWIKSRPERIVVELFNEEDDDYTMKTSMYRGHSLWNSYLP